VPVSLAVPPAAGLSRARSTGPNCQCAISRTKSQSLVSPVCGARTSEGGIGCPFLVGPELELPRNAAEVCRRCSKYLACRQLYPVVACAAASATASHGCAFLAMGVGHAQITQSFVACRRWESLCSIALCSSKSLRLHFVLLVHCSRSNPWQNGRRITWSLLQWSATDSCSQPQCAWATSW
jgi:hypothetical protein